MAVRRPGRRAVRAAFVAAVAATITALGVHPASSQPAAATRSAVAEVPVTTTFVLDDGRSYRLHYDPAGTTAAPLVIALHAANHSAALMEQLTGLTPFADSHGFVLAYGSGVGGRWNSGTCCASHTLDDVDYLRRLVADAATHADIDPDRVYVVGFSNGGMQAWRAICEAPDVFAAVGVVAGALLVPCQDTAVHTYHLHGLADTTVPLAGGPGFGGVVFPDSNTEPDRVGPYSDVRQQWWDGGHAWPAFANDVLWCYLQAVRLDDGPDPA